VADSLEVALARGRIRRGLPDPSVRRLLRQRAGLTQRELAAALGIAQPTLARWEAANRTPRGDLLERYSQALERLANAVVQS
jgi:transcriptional regulator with XRE-family HTH domain